MGARKDLVPKSVRLPADLVEYVESMEGMDFSKKLIGLLEDYRSGDDRRRKILKDYERQVEDRRAQLLEYSRYLRSAADVCRQMSFLLERNALAREAKKLPPESHARDPNIWP